jgi:hypothetical protein
VRLPRSPDRRQLLEPTLHILSEHELPFLRPIDEIAGNELVENRCKALETIMRGSPGSRSRGRSNEAIRP